MTNKEIKPDKTTAATEAHVVKATRSPLAAWLAVALTLTAWALLMALNGYVAMAVGAAAVVVGFIGLPGRSRAVRNLAITAIIASTVLIVVLLAFLIVIKIGLG